MKEMGRRKRKRGEGRVRSASKGQYMPFLSIGSQNLSCERPKDSSEAKRLKSSVIFIMTFYKERSMWDVEGPRRG